MSLNGTDTFAARSYAAVTKSDSTDLGAPRGLYVGGAGDVVLQFRGASASVTFTAVPAGTVLPVCCYKVMNATTATAIVALY